MFCWRSRSLIPPKSAFRPLRLVVVEAKITCSCDVLESAHSCGAVSPVCCWCLPVRGCCCPYFKGPPQRFPHAADVTASITACAPQVPTGSSRRWRLARTGAFVS